MRQLHIALENESMVQKEKDALRQALDAAVAERKQLIQKLSGALQVRLMACPCLGFTANGLQYLTCHVAWVETRLYMATTSLFYRVCSCACVSVCVCQHDASA